MKRMVKGGGFKLAIKATREMVGALAVRAVVRSLWRLERSDRWLRHRRLRPSVSHLFRRFPFALPLPLQAVMMIRIVSLRIGTARFLARLRPLEKPRGILLTVILAPLHEAAEPEPSEADF
jgi:hypothetical protein